MNKRYIEVAQTMHDEDRLDFVNQRAKIWDASGQGTFFDLSIDELKENVYLEDDGLDYSWSVIEEFVIALGALEGSIPVWRDVKKELPQVDFLDCLVVVYEESTKQKGVYKTTWIEEGFRPAPIQGLFSERLLLSNGMITHWMPLPALPKIEKDGE